VHVARHRRRAGPWVATGRRRVAHRLRGRVAEQLLRGGVPQRDPTVEILTNDGVGQGLHDGRELATLPGGVAPCAGSREWRARRYRRVARLLPNPRRTPAQIRAAGLRTSQESGAVEKCSVERGGRRRRARPGGDREPVARALARLSVAASTWSWAQRGRSGRSAVGRGRRAGTRRRFTNRAPLAAAPPGPDRARAWRRDRRRRDRYLPQPLPSSLSGGFEWQPNQHGRLRVREHRVLEDRLAEVGGLDTCDCHHGPATSSIAIAADTTGRESSAAITHSAWRSRSSRAGALRARARPCRPVARSP